MGGRIGDILDAVRRATIAQAAPVLPEPVAPGDPLPAPPPRPPLRVIDGGGGRFPWHAFRRFLPGFVAGASWQGTIAFLASAALTLRRDPLREPHPYQQIPILREPPRIPHVEPTPQQRWALFLRDAPLARRHPLLFDAAFRIVGEEQPNAEELFRQLKHYYGQWTPEATLRSIAWAAVESHAANLRVEREGGALRVIAANHTVSSRSASVADRTETTANEEEIEEAVNLVRSFAPHAHFPGNHQYRYLSVARVIEACHNDALIDLLFTIAEDQDAFLQELATLGDHLPTIANDLDTLLGRATTSVPVTPSTSLRILNTILNHGGIPPSIIPMLIREHIFFRRADITLLKRSLETIARGIPATGVKDGNDVRHLLFNAIRSEQFHQRFYPHNAPSTRANALKQRLSEILPASFDWEYLAAHSAENPLFQGLEGEERLVSFVRAIATRDIGRLQELFLLPGHHRSAVQYVRSRLLTWLDQGTDPARGLRPEQNLENVITIALDLIAIPPGFLSALYSASDEEVSAYTSVPNIQRFRRYAQAANTVEGTTTELWQVLRYSAEMEEMYRSTFGLVDERQALEAMRNKLRALRAWFDLPLGASMKQTDDKAFVAFNPHPSVRITITNGKYESECGFRFNLEFQAKEDGIRPVFLRYRLASLGFIETDDAIRIVQYQGGNVSPRHWATIKESFHDFSGNVDPLPWLALAAGRHLLERARAQGKRLEFIRGEYIRWSYPHDDLASLQRFEDTIDYWKNPPHRIRQLEARWTRVKERIRKHRAALKTNYGEHFAAIKKLEQYAKSIEPDLFHYRRGPKTTHLYNATAENLGFRRRGKQAWYRFTKAPETFGAAIRKARGVDKERLQQTLDGFSADFALSNIPFIAAPLVPEAESPLFTFSPEAD